MYSSLLVFISILALHYQPLSMIQRISLKTQASLDITNFHLVTTDIHTIIQRGALFCETDQVFAFDNIYALFQPRSRVLRLDKTESERVLHISCAVIDAGFVGKLVWKILLTPGYIAELEQMIAQGKKELSPEEIAHFRDAQQLMFFPCASGNYYNGSNQTKLTPEIIIGF